MSDGLSEPSSSSGFGRRVLDWIEWLGNKLPDPAMLFVLALFITWGLSATLSRVEFTELDPRSEKPIRVVNQLTGTALVAFLTSVVKTFAEFPPLGLALVTLLGAGVAEQTGLLQTAMKGLLQLTPQSLLTPMLLLVALVSHAAGDSGYVLIVPLGGVLFAAAGRHPVLGIVAAFAGVSGGFSASFLPTGLDPLLQGFTQKAAQIIDPDITVNPLCNWGFMSASCVVIVAVGWYVTEKIIAPRLEHVPVDGDPADMPKMTPLTSVELRALLVSGAVFLALLAGLAVTCWPANSPWRNAEGNLAGHDAPLMKAIVPLLFLFFLLPGVLYGYLAGTVKTHRDIVKAMTHSMGTMSYYLVLVFFAAQFTAAFTQSNLGVLIAVKGANFLAALELPAAVTILCVILLTLVLDLIIGSASAKWALLGPILVPMLMSLGISPELTQAAYRIGDSCANVATPLMPYFPLVVVFIQRYVRRAGIGTLLSLMVPYTISFLIAWSILLMVYWQLGLPLGLDASYTYPR